MPIVTREQLRQFFRLAQTIAVPVILALVSRKIWGEPKEEVPTSLYLPLLADIGFAPRALLATYRVDAQELDVYERVSVIRNATTPGQKAEVTAVLLNWSRFPNLLLITSLMCAPWLQDTVAQVFIWNNHPKHLRYEDLKNTGCPKSKIQIHNAPYNMLFQARYLACAQADTPYCFIQDDDYLVHSEIIESLHARINTTGAPNAIHLLPSHDHLSTALREIYVPAPDSTHLSDIHTSFAWLGYGTMMRRTEAQRFMTLLKNLKLPREELAMADNFFTLLSNRVPEVWFDQGFELGGGQPFTVGSEGDERNKNYTLRATRYLENLTRCGRASCDDSANAVQPSRPQPPYINLGSVQEPSSWIHSACRGAACVINTNIRMLPDEISHSAENVSDIFVLEAKNIAVLSEHEKTNYLQRPLSNAADMKPDTIFRSMTHATKGDIITMDVLTDISEAREWTAIELVWLIDRATEDILKSGVFEWSSGGDSWHTVSHPPICYDTKHEATVEETQIALRECSVQMILGSSALHLRATGQYFRVRLEEDKADRWTISEVWLRGF